MAVALDKAIDTPLLKALQGVTDSVARGMEKKLKSALTPIQLLVATSQYLTFHPKAAKATFDDTGIPQTFQGIVMLVQKPTMVAEAFKESLVHEYHEIQEAAKSGDYRRTGQLVGKAVFESAEFLTSFGKTDTLLTHTPAQLKKLGNVSTATRKEVAVIQEIAEKHGLEIGIRTADPLTAAVRKIATQFHLPNKPSSIKEKTFFGLLYHKETKQWIITDLDVSFIKKNGQLVNNSEGLGYLNEINAKLNAMGLQSPFLHGSHSTASSLKGGPLAFKDYLGIGSPGQAAVFNGKKISKLNAGQVSEIFENHAYGWPREWGNPHHVWNEAFLEAVKEFVF